MKDTSHKLESLGCKFLVQHNFHLTVLQEPSQLSRRVLLFVELDETILTTLELWRKLTLNLIRLWPICLCEDLEAEIDGTSFCRCIVLGNVLIVLGQEGSTQFDVSEHLRHVICVFWSALNLQLLQHELFGLLRNRTSI